MIAPKSGAIVLAGGTSSRMQDYNQPKQFLPLGDQPLIAHSLQQFDRHPWIQHLVVAIADGEESPYIDLLRAIPLSRPLQVVIGGTTRQHSSFNSLQALHHLDNDIALVAIHDAARPFISQDMISQGLDLAHKHGAAEPSVPVTDTIVRQQGATIAEALKRDELVAVQTPQCFQFDLIWQAHQQAQTQSITDTSDDALLIHRLGYTVHLFEGSLDNFKVTHPDDYAKAKDYAASRTRP